MENYKTNYETNYESFKKSELINRAREMGLKGYYKLNKVELIEFVKNAPPKIDDGLDELSRTELMKRAREMRLQGRYQLKKQELINLIRHPPLFLAKHKRKVILEPIDPEADEETFVFPSINAAAKHFKINPGSLGWKVVSKNEKTKNTMIIRGVKYKLRFENYMYKPNNQRHQDIKDDEKK